MRFLELQIFLLVLALQILASPLLLGESNTQSPAAVELPFRNPEVLYLKYPMASEDGTASWMLHPRLSPSNECSLTKGDEEFRYTAQIIEVTEKGYRVELEERITRNGIKLKPKKESVLFHFSRLTELHSFKAGAFSGFYGNPEGARPSSQDEIQEILKLDCRRMEKYDFSKSQPIESRIKNPPNFVLDALSAWLDNRPLSAYTPSESELQLIKNCILNLPPLHKRTINDHLLGLYFINNLPVGGLTDFALNKDGETFCYIAINPKLLKQNISEFLSAKENSCFKDTKSAPIKIQATRDIPAFQVILLHETSHVVDFVHNFTPFTAPFWGEVKNKIYDNTPFIEGIWREYKKPLTDCDFASRSELTFYGMHGGPRIDILKAKEIYDALTESPFPSLYGATSSAEDFAEFVTFYHLSKKMNCNYTVELTSGEKTYSYMPFNDRTSNRRANLINAIYQD